MKSTKKSIDFFHWIVNIFRFFQQFLFFFSKKRFSKKSRGFLIDIFREMMYNDTVKTTYGGAEICYRLRTAQDFAASTALW